MLEKKRSNPGQNRIYGLFSPPVLKDSVGMCRWSGIAIGLSGAVIVMRPGTGIFKWISVLPLLNDFFI